MQGLCRDSTREGFSSVKFHAPMGLRHLGVLTLSGLSGEDGDEKPRSFWRHVAQSQHVQTERSRQKRHNRNYQMFMQSDLIEVKVIDCAGTIILKRPDHENRLTQQIVVQLTEAFDDLYHEKAVRAIILTGEGNTFCAGFDQNELGQINTSAENLPKAEKRWGNAAAWYRDLLVRMLEITKPIIASVNGPALSGGAGLVVASDIVVASENASFGLPDPLHGLVAGVVAPLLCYRVGAGHGSRLMLTSMTLEADEAYRIGLFHELVEHGKGWARAMELAQACAAGAPEAIQLTKRLLSETIGEHLETQLATGAVMQATSCTTQAAQEGIAAFLERRPPEWS